MNHSAYTMELMSIYKSISDDKKNDFITRFTLQEKNPTAVFGLSLYLGWLGVDRFVLGNVVLGILKLITLGGLSIWWFIDLFLVAGSARQKNLELARQIAAY